MKTRPRAGLTAERLAAGNLVTSIAADGSFTVDVASEFEDMVSNLATTITERGVVIDDKNYVKVF
ncbi:MAG: hypothetical protein EA407_03425 [Rhodobacteraceae bacterium]|nr:MAG: hypothetical protein EA407_03425 [Paracoccaceae bacterium]